MSSCRHAAQGEYRVDITSLDTVRTSGLPMSSPVPGMKTAFISVIGQRSIRMEGGNANNRDLINRVHYKITDVRITCRDMTPIPANLCW